MEVEGGGEDGVVEPADGRLGAGLIEGFEAEEVVVEGQRPLAGAAGAGGADGGVDREVGAEAVEKLGGVGRAGGDAAEEGADVDFGGGEDADGDVAAGLVPGGEEAGVGGGAVVAVGDDELAGTAEVQGAVGGVVLEGVVVFVAGKIDHELGDSLLSEDLGADGFQIGGDEQDGFAQGALIGPDELLLPGQAALERLLVGQYRAVQKRRAGEEAAECPAFLPRAVAAEVQPAEGRPLPPHQGLRRDAGDALAADGQGGDADPGRVGVVRKREQVGHGRKRCEKRRFTKTLARRLPPPLGAGGPEPADKVPDGGPKPADKVPGKCSGRGFNYVPPRELITRVVGLPFRPHPYPAPMITILSGTNRPNNRTRIFARAFLTILEELGREGQLLDLAKTDLHPVLTKMYDAGAMTPEVRELQDQYVLGVDKMIILAPEYNGSYPGALKLLIDGISVREYNKNFTGKKIALVGLASGRQGNLRGMDHLADIISHMGGWVLPNRLPISGLEGLLTDDELTDEATVAVMKSLAQQLIDA